MLMKDTIIRRLFALEKRATEEQKRHESVVNKIQEDRNGVIDNCPHEWEYIRDPSGNNDSYYTCKICQIERR